jgi:methylated-DNA-[protein]-cysteine S-methyltransferase
VVFPSDLGWMAAVLAGATVRRLTFGRPSAKAAVKALERFVVPASAGSQPAGQHCTKQPAKAGTTDLGKSDAALVRRLRAYAAGEHESLRDIPVDLESLGDFQRRVLEQCRRIPYGSTMSYAALAAKAGFPRAARAVGTCMAANGIPLLVPCHRVVRSDGQPGSYSAPGGAAMKRRLLALESAR